MVSDDADDGEAAVSSSEVSWVSLGISLGDSLGISTLVLSASSLVSALAC